MVIVSSFVCNLWSRVIISCSASYWLHHCHIHSVTWTPWHLKHQKNNPDQYPKSHNEPVPYPTIHHSEQRCAHFCSEWCIVGYVTGVLWDLRDCSTRLWIQWIARPNSKDDINAANYWSFVRNPLGTGGQDFTALQWCHNEGDDVSNHPRFDCLINRLFRRRSKKTPKLRVTGLCEGNPPVTGGFSSQRTSNAENVSIWWRHQGKWNVSHCVVYCYKPWYYLI